MAALLRTGVGKLVVAAVAALFVGAAIGLAVLWPGEAEPVELVPDARAQSQQAEDVESREITCPEPGCARLPAAGDRAAERSARGLALVPDRRRRGFRP